MNVLQDEIAKLQRWQEAVRDRCVTVTLVFVLKFADCVVSCRQIARLEELEENA